MGTSKKLSGKVMGYLILIGLVVLSWLIFKILTPHNFGSFSNMLNYFQASLIATVGAVGFYFVMVMGMFDFSIGANIMLSAIVGCVFATRFNMGYFGLIIGCVLTGAIVGILNGIFYVKLRIPSMIVTTGLALIYESIANYIADVKKTTLCCYMISGILSAIAGLVSLSRLNSAKADFGTSYTMQTILVAVLGGINPDGGFGNIPGIAFAVIILQTLSSYLNQFPSISNYYRDMIWGVALLAVLVFNITISKKRAKKAASK